MKRLIATMAIAIGIIGVAAPVAAHEGGHGPCRGGAPVALPYSGFAVEPGGAEFGAALKGLATGETLGQPARETVAQLHAGFCDSNTP